MTVGFTHDVATARAALAELQNAVLWELPRTHKGFHCTFDHDQVVRAFERARAKLAAGERPKPCRCAYCKARGETNG
jgi:hypothetical protein